MGEWSQMFRSNPDLGIMDQAYMKLKTQSRPRMDMVTSMEQS